MARSVTLAMQLAWLVLVVLIAAPACAFEKLLSDKSDEPYPVVHSKYSAESRGQVYRLSWLDNDRLLFAGEPIEEVFARFDKNKRAIPGKPGKLRFYIWNTKTNAVQTYKELSRPVRFCYNEVENRISYRVPEKRDAVMEGVFGNEREVRIDPAEQTPEGRNRRGVFFHDLMCREQPYAPKDSGVIQRRVFPLFSDHGILDVGGENANDLRPIKLFSNDYKRVTELPLSRRAVVSSRIYFSKYKNAYVLYGSTAPPSFANAIGMWPRGVNQPIYLLSPNGNLTLGAEIPWREHFGRALIAFFTARGLVYATGRPPHDEGLFLVRSGKSIRLLAARGEIWAAGGTPDGCKVAVAVSTDTANKSGGVKLIDLCKGEKR